MHDAAEFWSNLSGPEKMAIGLGSVALVLYFFWRRANSSGTSSAGTTITLPPAIGDPTYGSTATVPVSTAATTPIMPPAPTTDPTPAPVAPVTPPAPTSFAVSGVPFTSWIQNGEGSTAAINQTQIQNYLATGQQYAPQLNDPAFNDWLARGYYYTDSGPGAGDQAGVQAWKAQGYQFISGAIAAGDPLAQPVGIAGEVLPAPITRTITQPGGGAAPADTVYSSVPHLAQSSLAASHV